MLRPYGVDPQNAVNVVGHHHKGIQNDTREMAVQGTPAVLSGVSVFVQLQIAVGHIAEKRFPLIGADGDEIGSRLRVVIRLETDGASLAMYLVCHGY